ncbi:MAG: prephenate dehydrogenase/arogenate dehydrogenase family protein, partial [Nitrososphaerota archaeon]|nr:prephenate dehydrogenase/arogenate dehydrogenase family protein [Nitrososphaerota archaeon]
VPALEPGSTLVEISSVKGETLGELRRMVGRRASLLSVHPLFGPALKSERAMKVAVIVSKRGGEEEAARRLFPEARIIPMTRREHDKAMGVVLSLTHLVNLAYAGAVARLLSPKEFMKVSTPNSSMQLTLAQAVLAQDAELSYEIQANNPYSREAGRAAVREIERVMGLVEAGDRKGFEEGFAKLAREYKVDERAGAVVKEIYSAAEDAG